MFRPALHVGSIGVFLLVAVLVQTQNIRRTSGSSGQVCEDGFRKCLTRKATCINGTCQCNNRGEWRGNFACYSQNSYHMEITNDPRLRTLAGDSVPLPVTCRYLVSHFRTTFIGWNNSVCETVIHAHNIKNLGKAYVYGFDVALKVTMTVVETRTIEVASFRVYGTAFNGSYTFRELGSVEYRPDGPWNISTPPVMVSLADTLVRVKYDPYNNFAYVEVNPCGFGVRFRPFDTLLGKDQVLVPGLSFFVNPLHDPLWLSLDKTMAFVPQGTPSLESISIQSGLEREHAILLRLAQSGVIQNQPNSAPQCTAWGNVVTSCANRTRRKSAFQTCTFILTTTTLVKCYDNSNNGNLILNLFRICFQSICQEDSSTCRIAQEEVRTCPRTEHFPPVHAFLRPESCQFV